MSVTMWTGYKSIEGDKPRYGGDGQTGYDLSIYDNSEDEYLGQYEKFTLTGQLYGIGFRSESSGNYNGQKYAKNYVKEHYPQFVDQIVWDSESGQFFCYSNNLSALECVVMIFGNYIDRIKNAMDL